MNFRLTTILTVGLQVLPPVSGTGPSVLDYPAPMDLISTNLAPDMPALDVAAPVLMTAFIAFEQPFAEFIGDQTMVCFGTVPGVFRQQVVAQSWTNCVVSNLDARFPWWFTAFNFLTTSTPQSITCINDDEVCFTNYLMESTEAPAFLLATSNMLPYPWISNGTFCLMGWGNAPSNYSVYAGSNADWQTNLVYQASGTNGVWVYTEPYQGGNRFFRTEVTEDQP